MRHDEPYGTSRRVAIGILLFAIAVASMGFVIATDINSSNQGGTLTGTVSSTAPKVFWFDIADSSNNSLAGAQINVLTTYYFNVSVYASNGWKDVASIAFHIWYDNGTPALPYLSQGAGKNYAASLSYSNPARTSPYMTDFTTATGNIDYIVASSSNRTNLVGQNYTLHLAFKLHAQMHHALGGTLSGTGYDIPYSWNAEVVVTDVSSNVVTVQKNTAGKYLEFGVFQYTSISLGTTTWNFGTLVPGQTGTSPVTITYKSNGNYSANVTLMALLTDSNGDTIAASAVSVSGGAISSTAFGGIGAGHTIYFFGASSSYAEQAANADYQTVTVTFSVTVPLGTPTGTYSAAVVFTLNQQSAP